MYEKLESGQEKMRENGKRQENMFLPVDRV